MDFLFVYIREAHPIEEMHRVPQRRRGYDADLPAGGIGALPLATSTEERREGARTCTSALGLTLPTLIDDMSDSTSRAYGAWPDRIYVVDQGGKVVFDGGPGPFGFDPDALEAALSTLLSAP